MVDGVRADATTLAAGEGTVVVGRSVLRKEDRPLLTGDSCFVDDLARPDALRGAVLRSPHAHARIVSIDASRAREHPEVVDVLTGDDLPESALRIPMRMYPLPGMERLLQPPLARGIVRYSGEPVAFVVARSRYGAEDALDLVDVEYEPLEPVLDPEAALEAGAPILHPDVGTNLAASSTIDSGDVDGAFAEADVVVEETLCCHRHAAVPMEPRGLVAAVDEDGRLTLWGAAKVVHTNKRILAGLLDWPEERVRLIELDVGGGFGARGEFYPEDLLVPLAAIRTGRPVAWTEDRAENLRALNHSREQQHRIAIALRADGTFLALRDRFVMNTGAYVRTHGNVVPGLTAALLPGPYRWPAYRCEANQVVTNKTPAGTYRAPGRYEANFVRERIIDVAARRLGRDPVDLRRQNLLRPDEMPHPTGSHADGHPVVLDSGKYPLLLDKGLERFDYAAALRWRDQAPAGRRRGVGVGFFVEKSGIARWEYARVGIAGDGRALVFVSSASVGQGVDTVLAQICADSLGVGYDDVRVQHGDTDVVPKGMGAFGSRATSLGGTAVMQAAAALRQRLLDRAAEQLEAAPQDLVIAGDRIAVRGSPGTGVELRELLGTGAAEGSNGARAAASAGLLEEESVFDVENMSFPYGLHCAAVEVDLETGALEVHRYGITYDVGRAINPRLVEGQIIGGLAQGLGGALLEELAYDDGGQLVSGSFMDYLMPTAGEVPAVDVLVTEDAPTPLTPLGAKGAGEGGTSAAGAALANAVSNALDAEVRALPLSPERLLDLARQGESHTEPSATRTPTDGGT